MMKFGTFLLMQSPSARSSQEIYTRGVEVAQTAEALGFRSVWLAEHHFSTYGYLSRPAQLATYIAAKTTRLRVGTAVIVVPLHHPLVVAEEIATLDLLTGGRLDVGLGRGYQHYEFERLGLELESGRARWEESVDIIMKAFEGRPFSYDGKIFKIPETMIFPQPVQKPRPPIWITAQSPDSVEGAVRRGFNVLTGGFGVPIERMAEFRRLFDRVVAEVKPREPLEVGVQRAVYVADDDADARAAAERALVYMALEPGTPIREIEVARVFIGSCTNSRIEDLRSAAEVARGRRVHPAVRAMVVPGSAQVKLQAENEGLDRIFIDAGFEWRRAGCSMCLGMNPDILQPGERCASMSNRNFEGRQGRGGRTHLVSPAVAAATAVAGHFATPEDL